jgi:hypothetical protein
MHGVLHGVGPCGFTHIDPYPNDRHQDPAPSGDPSVGAAVEEILIGKSLIDECGLWIFDVEESRDGFA